MKKFIIFVFIFLISCYAKTVYISQLNCEIVYDYYANGRTYYIVFMSNYNATAYYNRKSNTLIIQDGALWLETWCYIEKIIVDDEQALKLIMEKEKANIWRIIY